MARKFVCPAGCEITQGLVCGGSDPYHNHPGEHTERETAYPNVYFLMDLATGENTRELESHLPFELTDEDWQEMHEHADGGCCAEPQCPECLEYLDEVKELKVVALSDNTNAFGLRGVIFVSRTGGAWRAAASALNVPELGRVFSFTGDPIAQPPFGKWGFEIPERLPDPPEDVVRATWPEVDESPQATT